MKNTLHPNMNEKHQLEIFWIILCYIKQAYDMFSMFSEKYNM